MDGEKKRKRSKHVIESAVKEEEDAVVSPPPSEAEVDEFFAILRRMHVAVKYLQRSSTTAQGSKLPASLAGDSNGGSVAIGQKRAHDIVRNVGLDLNNLPEGGD